MRRLSASLALALLALACAAPAPAPDAPLVGSEPTPHIRRPVEGAAPRDAAADLRAVERILAGRWVGEAFGGVVEETWNPILGGEMIGTFRLIHGGEPAFSEILTLVVEEGEVRMRLKHFDPGLIAWEEKDESIVFELLDVNGTTAWFDGLTFHRQGNTLHGYLAMSREGEVAEEVFRFERAPL